MAHATVTRALTSIEATLAKLLAELHKVTLHKLDLVRQASLLGVLARTSDLEVVVVQAGNFGVAKPRNFTCRAANTTSNVENAHAWLEVHHRGKVVLMARELKQTTVS